jgi:hypothetical protein
MFICKILILILIQSQHQKTILRINCVERLNYYIIVNLADMDVVVYCFPFLFWNSAHVDKEEQVEEKWGKMYLTHPTNCRSRGESDKYVGS